MSPTELLLDQRQSSTTSLPHTTEFVRSNTSPWPQSTPPSMPSFESLPSVAGHPMPVPVLRKRHSTYIRPSERSNSPIPELPPHRPPRNPARSTSVFSETPQDRSAPKSKYRPSTATSNREDITPWDFQLGPGEEKPHMRSTAPSMKSKASSTGLVASTGTVEEVTPWELYPAPPNLPSRKHSTSSIVFAHTPSAPSPKTLYPTKPTGLVEDVTPWELCADPSSPKLEPVQESPQLPVFAPSRSKPASIISNPSVQSYRLSTNAATATGPIEEVTPWELQSLPTPEEPRDYEQVLEPNRQRNSLSMTKAQLEEVTPWELYPAPPVPVPNGGSSTLKKGSHHPTRELISSSKTLSDFGLARRRRSTGSRPSKTRSNSHPGPTKSQTRDESTQSVPNDHPQDSLQTPPKTPKSASPLSAMRPDIAPVSSTSYFPPKGKQGSRSVSQQQQQQQRQNPNFSTADRTILEELKRNIHARAAQFVMKGVAIHLTDGSVSPGKRHHPYSRKDVPYPRSYDREVIDLDVWETLFCQDISESLTWHVFEEPPAKVLDLGCGTGTWILHCARTWKDTQFVGLDLVPLHPDLQQVGSIDYAARITWVQANFLEGLPFPNDEFDFVHVKRIALGVPEDKWDALFDEISRVMKPGAALEMVEEDLFFPGKAVDSDDDEVDLGSNLSRTNSQASSTGSRREPHSATNQVDSLPESSESSALATPTTSTTAFPRTPSRPGSPVLDEHISISIPSNDYDDRNEVKSDAGSTTPPGSPKGYVMMVPPHSRSTARPLLYVKPKPNHNPYGHFQWATTSPPKQNYSSSSFGNSAVSLLNSLTHHSSDSDHHLFRRRRSSSNLTGHHINLGGVHNSQNQHTSSLSVDGQLNAPPPIKVEPRILPFLLRTPAQPPANPRDHSLLEYIYNETLSSRFINAFPLSLLSTYLEYHFKDARTHPPLMYTFPPVPVKPQIDFESSSEDEDNDYDEPRQRKPDHSPASPSRKSLSPSARSAFTDDSGELREEHRWLSMQGLLRHKSPYVSLDGTRAYAYPPSTKPTFIGRTKDGNSPAQEQSRLPNKTLNIDLRTLNLHLALRAKEVLACSESMWEWVEEVQTAAQNAPKNKPGRGVSLEGFHPSMAVTVNPAEQNRGRVLEMTRDDFNQLLLNFEMDMQDQASVNNALKERFHWSVIESAPSANRKIFNTACEKYEKYLRKENRSSISSSLRPARNSFHNPSAINVIAPTPDTPTLRDSASSTTRARRNSHTILLNPNGTDRTHLAPMPTLLKSDASVHFALPSSTTSTSPPTQKLSRSMCVFVAWKPEERHPKT